MESAQALADLTEVSSQIESAVLADAKGNVLASTFPGAKGERVAEAALTLLATSESVAGERATLTQLVAETNEGAVFVVRERGRVVVAVTASEPTTGLIFYDLRTCLRLAFEPPAREEAAAEEPTSVETATERRSSDA